MNEPETRQTDDSLLPFKWEAKYLAEKRGKSFRGKAPREDQATWQAPANRIPAVEQLQKTFADYLPDLVPKRYGRMLDSKFAFFRGAAMIMASDLVSTINSGIVVQCCGDCHLYNFGGFATPERQMYFDLNDFDETAPAPWEWDLKRLVTSFVIDGQVKEFNEDECRDIAMECVRSYRDNTEKYASHSPLQSWYERITLDEILEKLENDEVKESLSSQLKEVKERYISGEEFDKMMEVVVNNKIKEIKIKEDKPDIYHPTGSEWLTRNSVEEMYNHYKATLSTEKRQLLNRYKYQDLAVKVVGIGSVGKACGIALLLSADNEPIFLQVKEARPSVLEVFHKRPEKLNDGERIVEGQKLMQAASDIFLGWCTGRNDKQFYIRQLRDMKVEPKVKNFKKKEAMVEYAGLCGWALARAHSRTGKAALIAGYIGKSEEFLTSIAEFAFAYARQNNEDFQALKKAEEDGTIKADPEKSK